ncbi:hypothetical protein EUGRSUZ_B01380 [Eucalyptus grandis]|uniref:Uncharacterized protein n=2 Tax=Eucalyptus grandis TaxID=71139 RepID=A0ACC3LQU5_EUCGR|nr:hypothetical protein EUGRSUZ_B01380 [Eucalyptus grandis]
MSQASIKENEVDIVIGAIHPDLTSFMNGWRSVFSRFHLIIVKDPDLKQELNIPDGFDVDVYTKSDIDRVVGSSSISFSGYSCRYFGFLVSRKKYVVSIDDDCLPAQDSTGDFVDAVAQHIVNLTNPATPFFFNTLYDPYCKGADFVRGYPFSLRTGVACALSCGLWLNLADYDAPTQALKPGERNARYVDAVLTIPTGTLMPSVRLPRTATTAEDCVVEMAGAIKQQLGATDPVFARAAEAMVEWIRIWKAVGSGSPGK